MTSRPLEAELRDGLLELSLDLSDQQVGQLLDYSALIQKWTRVYNLTALREPREVLTHHLLDSLAVVGPLIRECEEGGRRLLDVGSGAGLPGAVIAITCPQFDMTCVDTVAKKAAFIQQVATSLGLSNLRGVHARVESLKDQYDVITSRAFASLADFVGLSGAALKPSGIWMAMKGKRPDDEIAVLPPNVQVFHVEHLQVPQLDAERCLVWLRRAAS